MPSDSVCVLCALSACTADYAGVFVVIGTTDGQVFGAYCDKKLYPRASTTIVKYTGRRGCFVFRFKPATASTATATSGGSRSSGKGAPPPPAADPSAGGRRTAGDEVEVWRWSGLNEMFFRQRNATFCDAIYI